MLRDDLINLLAQHDNDTVTVKVNGYLVDVVSVAMEKGSIAIVLDLEVLPKGLSDNAPAHTLAATRALSTEEIR